MPLFPSAEWFHHYRDAINDSDAHREAARGWVADITYVIEAEPELGVNEDTYAWMDLADGECREVKLVPQDEGERADYVIRAPYSRWKDVIAGRLDPVKGMISGRLVLRGDLHEITRYVDAARELVSIASVIPTTFPDE